ncbi:hypothetical protein BCR33DRAFT_856189 [Rhizoclosmatium globosum]|uniref:Uncharacterized protein n=1 Tax=Rhizoclosmatium globosum TaxID=329046 RepID=A0A1Y2BG40_9FUNG|nr:hypothetical protein BCR33DRAFT_856189 [Rhizoclosmatium globosum]|eukprot:ORY33530.1 hypothetical protein BCR33DRAFT_856189 [Rhizoclosmatium globosum]
MEAPRVLVVSLFLPLTASTSGAPPPLLSPAASSPDTSSAISAVSAISATANNETVRTFPVLANSLRPRRLSGSSAFEQTSPTPATLVIEQSGSGTLGVLLQNAVESVRLESLAASLAANNDPNLPPPSVTQPPPPTFLLPVHVSRAIWESGRCCLPVFLTADEIDGHYNQFCKQVLWRPFHYQLPDYPKGQAFEERSWKQYVAVNRKFAEVIIANHQPNDIVWVNDYHLMLVPQMVRQAIPNATIGFFLHIPFPSSEIFRCLHVRKQILEGILGADLVGFQTYSFLRHFLMTCTRLLSLDSTPRGIQLENKAVKVGIFPIGINVDALNIKRNRLEVNEMIVALREKYQGMKVLIGRDKNDLVKGVRQKMLAFELFLSERKEFQSKVVLIQVALSTTEENENESQVNEIVSRINSKFGTIEYLPVVYLQQNISFSHYLALLSIADACLITSLRDGMNLTSHEYVVCQQEKKALSSSVNLPEHTQSWVQHFVSEIPKVHEELERMDTSHIPLLETGVVVKAYQASTKRIFFLDHDGTISHHVPDHQVDEFVETDASVVALVRALASDPQNLVYVMSGRGRKELIQFVGIPNVGLCAENGCFVLYANQNKWHTMLTDQDLSWRKQVVDIFEYYTDRTPGSSIQQNEISIIWHFGRADSGFGSWQALECQNHIQNALGSQYPITILAKKKKIEICPRNVNKGRICRRILEHHYQGKLSKRSSFPHPPPPTRQAVIPVKGGSLFNSSVTADMVNSSSSSSSRSSTPEPSMGPDSIPTPPSAARKLSLSTTPVTFDFIMCIGDDRADEFMFEYVHLLDTPPSPVNDGPDAAGALNIRSVVQSLQDAYQNVSGRKVFSVTVGSKSSSARWHLAGVDDVVDMLDRLVKSGVGN